MGELALPYVPIDPFIDESERMDAFVEAIGDCGHPFPEGYVWKLLLWAGRARPNGDLGRISARLLARKCRWDKDPSILLGALTDTGWLIPNNNGGYRIEGWERHGGKVLEAREAHRAKNRERQRRHRERATKNQPLTARNADVTRDSRVTNGACNVTSRPMNMKGEYELIDSDSVLTTCDVTPSNGGTSMSGLDPKIAVANTAELESYVASHGWATQLEPANIRRLHALIAAGGPLTAYETDLALGAVKSRKTPPSRPVAYFLSIVEQQRRDAEQEKSQTACLPRTQVVRPASNSERRERLHAERVEANDRAEDERHRMELAEVPADAQERAAWVAAAPDNGERAHRAFLAQEVEQGGVTAEMVRNIFKSTMEGMGCRET